MELACDQVVQFFHIGGMRKCQARESGVDAFRQRR
jgi:hypothetical protein